jgi:hypothetical protein
VLDWKSLRPPLRKIPSPHELLTQIQPPSVIHREHLNRCASNRSDSFNPHAAYAKVILPLIPARVEDRHDFLGQRVNPRKIRTLSQIATMASQRQVAKFLGPAMLLGNNVFNVVSEITMFLLKKTILTPILGPPTDQISHLGVCHGRTLEVSLRAFSLRIAMKSAALIKAS